MMRSLARFLAGLLIFPAWATYAIAQTRTKASDAPEQFAEFGDFKLQSGKVIRGFRLGYRTVGTLNAEKSNAVLWIPWLGGRSEDLLQYVGPANVVDSGKYFAILVDPI